MTTEPEQSVTHSKVGASSAYRWFNCPGSVNFIKDLPNPSSIYARTGTAVHWVVEQELPLLKPGVPINIVDKYAGTEAPNGIELSVEDVEAGELCLRYVDSIPRRDIRVHTLHSEVQFNIKSIHPDLFGTADIVITTTDFKKLKVIDYKHGAGVPVEVKNNKQLMYYALGAIEWVCDHYKLDWKKVMGWGNVFNEVEITVVQPRCRHKDGSIRSWVVPPEKLEAFADELKQKVLETQDPKALLVAGDHCKFCPGLATCPAFSEKTALMAQSDFKKVSDPKNLQLPDVQGLGPEEIAKIMKFSPLIKEWLEAVGGHALGLLKHGQEVPGFKLVKKRANRKWKDEDVAVSNLEYLLTPAEMMDIKSPAKIEKLLKGSDRKLIEKLVYKPETGVAIAPESDKRAAIASDAVSDFTPIT